MTTELSDEPLDVTTTVASTTTAVPATTESPDEPLDATTTTEAPAETTTTTTEAPVVLTDSFRGVTVETIKVGFASIDFEEFTETYGIPLPYANYDDMVDAYVAHINSTGGIHGRMIELVHSHFLSLIHI